MSDIDLSKVDSLALYRELTKRGLVVFIDVSDLKGFCGDVYPDKDMPTDDEMLEALKYMHLKHDFGEIYSSIYEGALDTLDMWRKEGGGK